MHGNILSFLPFPRLPFSAILITLAGIGGRDGREPASLWERRRFGLMAFSVDYGIWGGIFAVPTSLADKHLKLCSGSQLKVLLLALRDAPNPVDERYIAKRLGMTPEQVFDCLEYWELQGIFRRGEDSVDDAPTTGSRGEDSGKAASTIGSRGAAQPGMPSETPELKPAVTGTARCVQETAEGTPGAASQIQRAASSVSDTARITRRASQPDSSRRAVQPPLETRQAGVGEQKITTLHSRTRLTPAQINQMSRQDKNIPFLLQELQQRLGKTLSPAQTEALVYTYSYFDLTPDYLLMVAEYCKSIGKGHAAYIAQTAAAWAADGIDTHERVEAHIRELSRKDDLYRQVQAVFGIGGRNLTTREKNYIDTWFGPMGLEMDLVRLAYERTVDNTGKLAFGYLNGILTRWHEKGIETPQQAVKDMENGRPASPAKAKAPAAGRLGSAEGSSYDTDEISRMMDPGKQPGRGGI